MSHPPSVTGLGQGCNIQHTPYSLVGRQAPVSACQGKVSRGETSVILYPTEFNTYLKEPVTFYATDKLNHFHSRDEHRLQFPTLHVVCVQ